MKKLIAELPTLTAPMEKEEPIVYLAAAREVMSVVLMTEREGKQMSIYFVIRSLQGRLHKWSIDLGEYDIHYRLRVSIKGQILADFIVERPEDDSLAAPMEFEEELPDPLALFTNGSSCIDGSGVLVEVLKEKSINEAEVLTVMEEEGNIYRFGLPGKIIFDKGKQFRDNPFKDLCEKLNIRQCFAFVKHPQANSLVERENRSLGEGMKNKSNNSSKISMPTLRTTEIGIIQNDEDLKLNMDLLEEFREQAAIREARNNAKMEKYYNSKVRNTSFKPGDLV
ncbi:reverse transcriptase domain-containing protein [Tanacetum coccineum]